MTQDQESQPVVNYADCLTKTFPFGVLFREQSDTIVVMAIMHWHRDPDYWKQR